MSPGSQGRRPAPFRRIIERIEFDYEEQGAVYHGVSILMECGHREALGAKRWSVHVKRRCWQCADGVTPLEVR